MSSLLKAFFIQEDDLPAFDLYKLFILEIMEEADHGFSGSSYNVCKIFTG